MDRHKPLKISATLAWLGGLAISCLPLSGHTQELQRLTITSTADSGPGTLRAAINTANQTPGPALIRAEQNSRKFKDPQTILLTADLPEITDDLEINGYIEKRLWQATGITVHGSNRYRLFRSAPGVALTLRHFTLSGGRNQQGGAIQSRGSTVVDAMLLMDNQAEQGGAIAQLAGSLTVINSTLLNNSSQQQGGALFHAAGQSRLTHTTITANQAPEGAGVYSQGGLLISNSILANNLPGDDCHSATDIDKHSTHNLIVRYQNCGTPLSSQDPILGKLNYYNGPTQSIPLGSRSPAINFGDNASSLDENGKPLVWDQRGNGDPRATEGIVDIGAFEQQAVVKLVVDTDSDDDLRFCTIAPNDCSLRGAIMLANASDRHNRIGFDRGLFSSHTMVLEYSSPLPPVTQPLELFSDNDRPVVIDLKRGKDAFLGDNMIKLKNVIIK